MAPSKAYLHPIGDIRAAEGDRPSASRIYRNITAKDGYPDHLSEDISPASNAASTPTTSGTVATQYDLFQASIRNYGAERCLGWRPVVDGKASDYEWLTYKQAGDKAQHVASGLAGLGLTPGQPVGVYGSNSVEWMLSMLACSRMSYQCVPLYDSLGESAVEFIINHCEAAAVLCDSRKLPALAKACQALAAGGSGSREDWAGSRRTTATTEAEESSSTAAGSSSIGSGEGGESAEAGGGSGNKLTVKAVVFWGSVDAEAEEVLRGLGVAVLSFDELQAKGQASPVEAVPPAAGDICTIMYTSGTTGDPKGVLLTHTALLGCVNSLISFVYDTSAVTLGPGDTFLSYLPLAHSFDWVTEVTYLARGGAVGYWQGEVAKLVDDIAALKPTIFIGVPRVFDRICTRVADQVEAAGGVKKRLFDWGYARKLYALQQGYRHDKASPLFDWLVFSKVAAKLGGRMKLIVSGGAPLAPHLEEFLKVTMCAPVVQGYGLTETCAASCLAVPNDWQQSTTNGPPTACTELRLESVPEMGYDATAESEPAGEVLLRGPQLFSGYYKQPDKTKDVMDADGWFHTGDIGMLTKGGGLKIVDRKKNIFKLSQGEYVAVEKLEAIYKKCSSLDQIWVYGDSFKSSLVAVVVPKEGAILGWASSNNKSGSVGELCQDPAAKSWMLGELKATGKANKTKGYEVIKALLLEPVPFTPESDCMTPTFKLKRPQLKQRYQAQIDAMYADLEPAQHSTQHTSAAHHGQSSAAAQKPSAQATPTGAAGQTGATGATCQTESYCDRP